MHSRRRTVALVAIAVILPVAMAWLLPWIPSWRAPDPIAVLSTPVEATPLAFERVRIGAPPSDPEWITNVQVVDLDGDGQQDVVLCDARRNGVFWCRQDRSGTWEDRQIGVDLLAPAHATPVDFDGDGDLDILVAVLGNIDPDDSVVGSVVLLESRDGKFEQHLLLDDVRRVADVQPADFDGDGDLDLAVAVFGYNRGQVLWLENLGELRFRKHELLSAAGTIHVPVADFDGDGDPDIAAVVSQETEEVWTFENLGGGEFTPHRVFQTLNFDLGTAGLVASDLDGDGDVDLILPAGDNLEDIHSFPQPYHGCYWLENQGNWVFASRKIADLGGTYAAAVADLDHDGDQDLVLVSMLGDGTAARPSLVWCENDGTQQFRTWRIDTQPAHLVTVSIGDLDGDGRSDIVAGSLDVMSPLDVPQRITAWMNRGK